MGIEPELMNVDVDPLRKVSVQMGMFTLLMEFEN